MTIQRSPLIDALGMKPHPEGGWYKETWKAAFTIPRAVLGEAYSGDRQAASAVYFLLHPGETSAWHTVLSDELWLWHSGSPILLTLGGDGEAPVKQQEIVLGMDIARGERPQVLVPARVWQTARPLGDEPTLVTCIVAPAFHFDDFRMADD
jgi:hypothetical protein